MNRDEVDLSVVFAIGKKEITIPGQLVMKILKRTRPDRFDTEASTKLTTWTRCGRVSFLTDELQRGW